MVQRITSYRLQAAWQGASRRSAGAARVAARDALRE